MSYAHLSVCLCVRLCVRVHACLLLNCPPDKRLFETKRKDQLNALKNLVELNDINQQYKIIDIMLKGLFKVSVCTHARSLFHVA